MVTSDFWSKVEIWPFRACAMENMQFGPYLWPNRQNSSIIQQIGVRDYDGDVRCLIGSRNMEVSRMGNKKYAIWPLVMAESPKLLHSSAMDLWTRLWGRYHVPQNVFLVMYVNGSNSWPECGAAVWHSGCCLLIQADSKSLQMSAAQFCTTVHHSLTTDWYLLSLDNDNDKPTQSFFQPPVL